jgi:hypothetical protein
MVVIYAASTAPVESFPARSGPGGLGGSRFREVVGTFEVDDPALLADGDRGRLRTTDPLTHPDSAEGHDGWLGAVVQAYLLARYRPGVASHDVV